MPVLPPEPSVFPDNLLAGPAAFMYDDMRAAWWVLHTRPRAEKALARALIAREVPFFLPLARRRHNRRRRTVESYVPLFPGYVFILADEWQRVQALETNSVVTTLPVGDQVRLRHDLVRLFQLVVSGAPLTPEDRIEPGTWVEITGGPLVGMCGRIVRRANQVRLVVEIDFLQRGASVEIDDTLIKPLTVAPPRLRKCA